MDVAFWIGGSVLIGVILIWQWRQHPKPQHLPPGPYAWPVVGNLLLLTRGDLLPHLKLARLAAQYGPVVYLRLGSMPTVVVSSATAAKEFLHTHDKIFASRPPSEVSESFQYGSQVAGLAFAPYDSHWREMRRLSALHLFSAKRVTQFQMCRVEEVGRLVESIRQHHLDMGGSVFNLTRAIAATIENLICRMLLSRRLSDVVPAQDGQPSRISSIKDVIQEGSYFFQIPIIGDFIPYLGFLDRKVKKSMRSLHVQVDAFWEALISEREKLLKGRDLGDGYVPRDILDVLLINWSNRDAIKTCLLDLLAAGMETTSATVDWAMAELMSNPHILKKLQDEVDSVVGMKRVVDESDLPRFPYLKAVIKEVLRLHMPVPLLLPHMSTEPCEVMGYSLPKGTRLIVNAWVIARDPTIWQEPGKFIPERFLEDSGIDVQGQHFQFIPFGAGRRSCPAIPLAMPILELMLTNLVHCFEWHLAAGEKVDMSEKPALTVCRQEPLLAVPLPQL